MGPSDFTEQAEGESNYYMPHLGGKKTKTIKTHFNNMLSYLA